MTSSNGNGRVTYPVYDTVWDSTLKCFFILDSEERRLTKKKRSHIICPGKNPRQLIV